MSAILKFDFQKRKQLRFSEVKYLNYTKKTQFCMWPGRIQEVEQPGAQWVINFGALRVENVALTPPPPPVEYDALWNTSL